MSAWEHLKTPETRQVEAVLRKKFPKTEAYRYNSASIRVRIIDKKFQGKSWTEREDMVFPIIETMPEDTQADIMILILLSPKEVADSPPNWDFERPTPSMV